MEIHFALINRPIVLFSAQNLFIFGTASKANFIPFDQTSAVGWIAL